jgi:transcription elongation factor GreA
MSTTPMTKLGAEKLQAELEKMKRVERPKIIEAISEARAHGDLKENAEYKAAKEQQALLEGRIKETEAKLSHAQIIDVSNIKNDGKVIFGATVTLINCETDEKYTYQIVGVDEADIKAGKISFSSPIGKGIIGKIEGDEVTIKTPKGEVDYEIEKVEYL